MPCGFSWASAPARDQTTQRETWDNTARAVESYRIADQIDPAEPTALGSEPDRWDTPWRQHIDWESAGEHVLDAREQLAIEDPGLGPTEQRMARVQGLIPKQDRDRALERDLGWEL